MGPACGESGQPSEGIGPHDGLQSHENGQRRTRLAPLAASARRTRQGSRGLSGTTNSDGAWLAGVDPRVPGIVPGARITVNTDPATRTPGCAPYICPSGVGMPGLFGVDANSSAVEPVAATTNRYSAVPVSAGTFTYELCWRYPTFRITPALLVAKSSGVGSDSDSTGTI